MSDCEICGRSGANNEAVVEGSKLKVCKLCASLGQAVTSNVQPTRPAMLRKPVFMPEELKVEPREDIGSIVRKGREKLGLTQGQLTERLKLPGNMIKRIENGWTPPLDVLERLETITRVSLLEGTGSSIELRKKLEKKMTTIGDIAELKA